MYTSVAPPTNREIDSTDSNNRDKNAVKVEERPPAGVSESNWKKFQELKKRREQCGNKSAQSRRQERRRLVTNPVSSQLSSQDELRILREYGIPSSPSGGKSSQGEISSRQIRKSGNHKNEAEWKDLKQYIHSNSGLKSQEKSNLQKQIEEEIDQAIKKGQFEKAECLNEQLSTQDFVFKVASAVKGRNFAKKRSDEQSQAQKTKKTKLHWGFEQKQRWESKGNM